MSLGTFFFKQFVIKKLLYNKIDLSVWSSFCNFIINMQVKILWYRFSEGKILFLKEPWFTVGKKNLGPILVPHFQKRPESNPIPTLKELQPRNVRFLKELPITTSTATVIISLLYTKSLQCYHDTYRHVLFQNVSTLNNTLLFQ